MGQKPLFDVLYALPQDIAFLIENLPEEIARKTEEIRLRLNKPLCLTVSGEIYFVSLSGDVTKNISKNLQTVNSHHIDECFKKLCNNSLFAHENELREGFIIMKNGCRAGVCGKLTKNSFMENITSINIRIAREIVGCADDLLKLYDGGGLLIAGPPASGKTTLLRDLVRSLSIGKISDMKRISLIDTRGELSGGAYSDFFADLGVNTDILLCEEKSHGIEIALRTMFPQIIAFDEIGTNEELELIRESFCAGVDIITTAHIGEVSELIKRPITEKLIHSGAIKNIAVLSGTQKGVFYFHSAKELL